MALPKTVRMTDQELISGLSDALATLMELDVPEHIDELVSFGHLQYPGVRNDASMKRIMEEIMWSTICPREREDSLPVAWEPWYYAPWNANLPDVLTKKHLPNNFSLTDIHRLRCTGGNAFGNVPASKVYYTRVEPKMAGVKMAIADQWWHQLCILKGEMNIVENGRAKSTMHSDGIIKIYDGEFEPTEIATIDRDTFLLRAAGVA